MDFGSTRKTLLDTEPLLLHQQWGVASSMGEGRIPTHLCQGVSDLVSVVLDNELLYQVFHAIPLQWEVKNPHF